MHPPAAEQQNHPMRCAAASGLMLASLWPLTTTLAQSATAQPPSAQVLAVQVPTTPQCPEFIHTRQQMVAPEAGWTTLDGATLRTDAQTLAETPAHVHQHALDHITLYAGPPTQQAALVPDRQRRTARHIVTQQWDFRLGDEVWLGCSYRGTSLELTRSLGSHVLSYSVDYDRRHTFLIKGIRCRTQRSDRDVAPHP